MEVKTYLRLCLVCLIYILCNFCCDYNNSDDKKRKFIERKWKRLNQDMKSAIIKVETAKQNTEKLDKDELNEHKTEFSELIKSLDQLISEIEQSISEPDNLQIDDSVKNWTETCAEMYSE